MLSDVLKRKDIYNYFSRSAMEKGLAYQAQRRVSKLQVSDDLTHVSARVRGSGSNVYQVDVALKFGADRLTDLDGDCSCPMEYNCKHVAATVIDALSGPALETPSSTPTAGRAGTGNAAAPSAPPVLSVEVQSWIEDVGRSVRSGDVAPDGGQRLLYCLEPSDEAMPSVAVSLRSVRVNKGGYADNYATPSLYDFKPDRPPKYFDETDVDLLTQITSRIRAYYSQGPYPEELLKRIVATGRAFWRDHKRKPLSWADAREGRIEWQQAGRRGVAPSLIVSGAVALNAEPPVYVDEAAGLIGPVQLGLPPRLARQFLSAPAIPRAQLEEVSRRLGQKLPELHHGLLPVPPQAAVRIEEDPRPVLRLKRGQVIYYYYRSKEEQPLGPVAVASLGFRYGPFDIDPTQRASRLELFQAGQVFAITRRQAKERQARKRLEDFGLHDARRVVPGLDFRHAQDFTLSDQGDWYGFVGQHAERLRSEGFEILIDDDFPFRLAKSSGDFDAELQSSGIDWFELAVGIEIDGERYDLAPDVAALVSAPDFKPDRLKQLADKGERFYLPLADGRHLAIAANRFLPLVLALHGLHVSGVYSGASEKIRLGRADVLPLLGVEDENFAFRGADNLRRLAGLLQVRGLSAPDLPPSFRATLRPYQAQGVAWLELLRESGLGGVLADDMGLGKTVQILALIALEKQRGRLANPVLVVAPTSLMTNWSAEAQKFAPDLKVLVLQGLERRQKFPSIAEHDLVLTTYPLIARDREVLLSREWHMAVLDEAQTVKNPDATTTRALREIKAGHRFCLTGTPMENHLGELWSIMSFANPGFLGDKAAFSRQWRGPIEKRGDKVRAAALARRVKPFLLRRTKSEVATELPAKSEILETIVLEGPQRDLYDSIRLSMSRKVREAIEKRGLAKSHIVVLEALLRMRQACCDPALLKLSDGVERPSAKLERLIEMVAELLSEGRKIIVFSQFTSMLDLIRRRFDADGLRYSLLTGETRDRKAAIDAFQNGATEIFLISLKAGGVGLNLTAADTVVIFDPWWNPAVEEQAIDRAHRIGQDKAVFVYRLVAAGTIEEKMDELKARKRALADSLFDRDGRIASALTEEDVRALFET
ncbi:helicase [Bradyrhizobium guangdongense]|uniref:DEAD/DEAH box helicase n=1 Tax=Bradyrhizobium guangdongense TaxID=1325090 RepID=UPI00112EBC13|nr:DEAD/DEAH box helicase [Bradyrhizobium guangdongense]TPQ40123.1 helicase [Bradyrhizobium guangdongense]